MLVICDMQFSPLLTYLVVTDAFHRPIAVPKGLTPVQAVNYGLTPISPFRQFHRIVAERRSDQGTLFKVVWRESWVHESKMPDVEPIRQAQSMQYGKAWEIL
jgi:hypothetical protein